MSEGKESIELILSCLDEELVLKLLQVWVVLSHLIDGAHLQFVNGRISGQVCK